MLGVLNAHVLNLPTVNGVLWAPVLLEEVQGGGSINGRELNFYEINGGPPFGESIELEGHASIRVGGAVDLHFNIFLELPGTIAVGGSLETSKLFFGGDYERRMRLPYEVRTVTVPAHEKACATMSECCLDVWDKEPADRLDYNVDFGPWLEVDDLVDGATAVVEDPESGLVIDDIETSRQVVRVWVSAGVDGQDSHIEVTATTTDGRTKVACFRIRVRECC